MILSELKKQVDFLCDTGHGDNLVLVTLSESSIGSRAATGITGIHSGIDLEHGQVRISTEKKIISYGKDRDEVIEPRREDYNIGLRIRHLLFCPKCDTQLRKDDYYCSHCGQRINNKGRDVISKVEDLFLAIEEKARIEEKSTECVSKLKMSANNLNLSDLNDCSYEECRDLFRQIKYYIDDENIAKALSDIIENKKIEKYPELLRPTYYPEIDSLDIPDSEKIRLDKAVRWNIRNRMTERKGRINPLDSKNVRILIPISVMKKRLMLAFIPNPINTHPAMYKVMFIASRKDQTTLRLIVSVVRINILPAIRQEISERRILASARNPKKKIAVRIPPITDTT